MKSVSCEPNWKRIYDLFLHQEKTDQKTFKKMVKNLGAEDWKKLQIIGQMTGEFSGIFASTKWIDAGTLDIIAATGEDLIEYVNTNKLIMKNEISFLRRSEFWYNIIRDDAKREVKNRVEIIAKIAKRAGQIVGFPNNGFQSFQMDLDFIDNEIGLDFRKLLNCDFGDFGHDVNGILENFNRKSKKMENGFLPRCAE